eukprot:jgi/Tetstr1/456027/TSEL_042803.t1
MATHAKLIPGTPYGKAVRPKGMTIPLGSLCSTGRIVEDVRQTLFRGQATHNHIRVHPQQPQGEDAFGCAFADILNNCAEPKQYDVAGKKHLLEAAEDKAVLSDVFDECWPRDTQKGIPQPLKKTQRFPIAAPPYIERICYATLNYRAGYTADNHVYAKETVMAEFREYTPSPFLPTPLRPSLWVVLTVHLVMYRKQGNVRNYLARHYFQDNDKDSQGDRKKVTLPSTDRLAKARDLAEEWPQSELGRYHYQAGKCPPANVMFKGEEGFCEVTPHKEAAGAAAQEDGPAEDHAEVEAPSVVQALRDVFNKRLREYVGQRRDNQTLRTEAEYNEAMPTLRTFEQTTREE